VLSGSFLQNWDFYWVDGRLLSLLVLFFFLFAGLEILERKKKAPCAGSSHGV